MFSEKQVTPEGNPMPPIVHQVIPSRSTLHRRVIIVGDVHGCASEFQRLLDRCSYRHGVDILISVGDLVNKGPSSVASLEFVSKGRCHAVRGNHDDAALKAYRKWKKKGKIPKKEKFKWVTEITDDSYARALHDMPFSMYLQAYNVLIVHAGIVPGTPLKSQSLENLIKMRDVVPSSIYEPLLKIQEEMSTQGADEEKDDGNDENTLDNNSSSTITPQLSNVSLLDWDGVVDKAKQVPLEYFYSSSNSASSMLSEIRGFERRTPAGKAWASIYQGPSHIFFGHDAGRRLQIHPFATGIDGGCVYGGKLYAVILPAMDEHGEVMPGRSLAPLEGDEIEEIVLGTGMKAHLVSVGASRVYAEPK